MSVSWTKEQLEVIGHRGGNLLVSAAAGSGKTAVLVERILSRVTDPEHPVDIDRLLIMTFTRAAAGEMRTRLTNALEARLEEDPENAHLARQTALIHNAQITTIHGFCSYVIRNYFHMADLDPGCRVAEQGEIRLLMGDVAKEVVNAAYEEEDGAFERFVESYSAGKTDEGLEELILQLYEFAMSNPWPEESLAQWEAAYASAGTEEMRETPWMREVWIQADKYLREARTVAERNMDLALEPDGPAAYLDTLQADLDVLEELQEIRDYDRMWEALQDPGWSRLAPVRDRAVSEFLKEQIQEGRKKMKDLLVYLRKQFLRVSEEEAWKTMADCRESVHALVELTLRFMDAYAAKKREKNMLDFSDLEHYALRILLKREDGGVQMTQAARELSQRYEEVMVDEYQDSNLVQEYLMNAVSGWARDEENLFMVGDVKQSIYRFRMARPELFMEKLRQYGAEKGRDRRIDLHRNFRSRPQVLESVNYLFAQIMGEELGGVEYDEDAALFPGAEFPPEPETGAADTEILFVENGEKDRLETGMNQRELEAMAIAGRIREMVGREQVLDPASGGYRPVEYGDIVILLRTMEGWADTFAKVLVSQGIPAYAVSKTGYFSAAEVVAVLDFLRICDNPRQEIPYTAVLHSPFAGCSAQELAMIRAIDPELPVYACAERYAAEGTDAALKGKLASFLAVLEEMRRKAAYVPIHEFLLDVFEKTGYREYVSALPGGAGRQANLDMLVEKARSYEKTSFRGLFHFVRYIDSLRSYQVDFGEGGQTDRGNTVEILSIHRSKGLEFPVVFVAGLGKNFNTQELRSPLVLHPELGIGADAVYPEQRGRIPTLLKNIIRVRTRDENLGEELRVLYVALTRAREKLILTGSVKDLSSRIYSQIEILEQRSIRFSYVKLSAAKSYWDWILPALMRHRDFGPVLEQYGYVSNPVNPLYGLGPDLRVSVVDVERLVIRQAERQIAYRQAREKLESWQEWPVEETLEKELEQRFSYRYPYEDRRDIPAKVSVSDLKHRQAADEGDSYFCYFEPDVVPLIPRFMEAQTAYTGAARGTVYHRIMECLDYGETDSAEAVEGQIRTMVEQGRLEEAMADSVKAGDIWQFASSSLGQRMRAASYAGQLYRERPFVILLPASEIRQDWPREEEVLVQGIIDAYFVEDGEIVLVDYKTDQVFPGREQELAERYRVQLTSYARALTRLTGRKVREIYIYSFTLGRALPL